MPPKGRDLVKRPNNIRLSEREWQVWRLLSQGKTNREIARELAISVGTVKTYVNRLYLKLGVTNRVEAVFRYTEACNGGEASRADEHRK